MNSRKIFILCLVILTLIAVFDISHGGLRKISNRLGNTIVLPYSGGTQELDEEWYNPSNQSLGNETTPSTTPEKNR
ncbi:MAG: hypothetical protein WCP87_02865 [Atribacterota bacterium]